MMAGQIDIVRYIYVVGCTGVRAVKIGSATDCAARLSGLQTGCPLPLALLWKRAALNAFAVEVALHERFSERRVRGEWFDLGLDPVPAVKAALATMGEIAPLPPRELSLRQQLIRDVAEVTEACGRKCVLKDGTEFMGGLILLEELRRLDSPRYQGRSESSLGQLIADALPMKTVQLTVGNGKRIRGYYVSDILRAWDRVRPVAA